MQPLFGFGWQIRGFDESAHRIGGDALTTGQRFQLLVGVGGLWRRMIVCTASASTSMPRPGQRQCVLDLEAADLCSPLFKESQAT